METKKHLLLKLLVLLEVLKNSDFVTLHIPKTDDKSVIGAEEIGQMKTGAGIINTSRGGLIDEDALMFTLDKGKLEYAWS